MSSQSMQVLASGGALGAEIQGMDLRRPLDDTDVRAVRAAWDEHLVLVFHGQRLGDDDLVAFSRHFGELDPPGPNPYGDPFLKSHPELNVISNIVEDGRPMGNLGDGEAVWHADMTYVEQPPQGAALYALELPPEGGDTWFANMFAAYEALPDGLRAAAEGKVAVHDASHNSAGMLRKGYQPVTDVRETPGARHPLIRTDAASGRRCLFLGRRPRSWVVGMPVDESDALLDALWEHATRPEFTYVHRWRAGDLLMWQNLCVLHRRDAFDPAARRRLHRAQIRGSEAIV
jgi:taurine dioxygenase